MNGKKKKVQIFVVEGGTPLLVGMPFLRAVKANIDLRGGESVVCSVATTEPIQYGSELSEDQKSRMKTVVEEFRQVFGGLGCFNAGAMKIRTKEPTCSPVKTHQRKFTQLQMDAIYEQLEEKLKTGVIEKSESPWASQPHLVRKGDGKWRFTVDYRSVNQRVKLNAYNLPDPEILIRKLGRSTWFAALDLKNGYWQVPLADQESKEITPFQTPFGLYQYRRVPQGFCISGQVFQECMDKVFPREADCPLVFVDDLLVHAETFQELVERTRVCLERLNTDSPLMGSRATSESES
eukprot:GHVP01018991.1.p1 GENE.GHVP01018991.1~~GHVP01018991.1.p1  ORF type:complete len:305 (-),score=27.38 GHVP01018991.1:99-977(-)